MPPDMKLRPQERPETAAPSTPADSHDHRTERGRRARRPWPRSIYEPLPLTDHQLDGAVDAAEHLMACGLPPIFALDTLRALWRRGDRELALMLARTRGAA